MSRMPTIASLIGLQSRVLLKPTETSTVGTKSAVCELVPRFQADNEATSVRSKPQTALTTVSHFGNRTSVSGIGAVRKGLKTPGSAISTDRSCRSTPSKNSLISLAA